MKNMMLKTVFGMVLAPLAALAISTPAYCEVTDFQLLKAVVDNPVTEQIVQKYADAAQPGAGLAPQFMGVERTQTFRCQGCYEYALKYRTVAGTQYRDARVRLAVIANAKGEVSVQEVPAPKQ